MHSPTPSIPSRKYTIRHLPFLNLTYSHSNTKKSSTTASLFVLWALDMELTLRYYRSATTRLRCKEEKERCCWQASGFGKVFFQQRHRDIYFHYRIRKCSEDLPTKVRMRRVYEMNDHCQFFSISSKHTLHEIEMVGWQCEVSYSCTATKMQYVRLT